MRVVSGLNKLALSFLIYLVVPLFSPSIAQAQNGIEDTVRVRTRVVSIDTLVSDKKTGASVADLTRENFEVLADGKPRTLSYFRREGEDRRRPLALVLVVDLVGGGPKNYLASPEILESLTAALRKLSPEDEVTVMAHVGGTGAPLKTLTDFTRDWKKVSEALAAVSKLPVPEPGWYADELDSILQRLDGAAAERPDSQIVVVPLTSGLGPVSFAKRDEYAARLIRANASFSPLIFGSGNPQIHMQHVPGRYPAPRPILGTIGRLTGWDIFAPGHIAEQTGGEATSIRQPADGGAALEKLIANLAARYNLGFTLNQNEQDDGRMHKLEVRVKARDSRGKERKLIVRAHRGYYIPKENEMPKK